MKMVIVRTQKHVIDFNRGVWANLHSLHALDVNIVSDAHSGLIVYCEGCISQPIFYVLLVEFFLY